MQTQCRFFFLTVVTTVLLGCEAPTIDTRSDGEYHQSIRTIQESLSERDRSSFSSALSDVELAFGESFKEIHGLSAKQLIRYHDTNFQVHMREQDLMTAIAAAYQAEAELELTEKRLGTLESLPAKAEIDSSGLKTYLSYEFKGFQREDYILPGDKITVDFDIDIHLGGVRMLVMVLDDQKRPVAIDTFLVRRYAQGCKLVTIKPSRRLCRDMYALTEVLPKDVDVVAYPIDLYDTKGRVVELYRSNLPALARERVGYHGLKEAVDEAKSKHNTAQKRLGAAERALAAAKEHAGL